MHFNKGGGICIPEPGSSEGVIIDEGLVTHQVTASTTYGEFLQEQEIKPIYHCGSLSMLQALVPTRLSVKGATRIASPGVASAGGRRQLSLISGLPVHFFFGGSC